MTLKDKLQRYYDNLSFTEKLRLYGVLLQLKFAWKKFVAIIEAKPPPKPPRDRSSEH